MLKEKRKRKYCWVGLLEKEDDMKSIRKKDRDVLKRQKKINKVRIGR
jgi:hypothetical protein